MDWKEELVLQFRHLTIDKNIISRAMKNFVDTFNNNLNKYSIDTKFEVTSDLCEYINIRFYKKISIKYNDNKVTFIMFNTDGIEEDIFIELRIVQELGQYLINYVNTEKIRPKLEAFIDENTIDEIFKDLFELNREVKHINL